MVTFQNEDDVSAVIASHATKDGTYILPAARPTEGMTPAEKKGMQAAVAEKMRKGPMMVAAVRRGGFGSFSQALITQLLCLMAAAFLLTWLLLQTSGLGYAKRVVFLAVAGLAAFHDYVAARGLVSAKVAKYRTSYFPSQNSSF